MSQDTHEHIFDVESPAKLNIKNIRGSIIIKSGDDNQIKVNATKYLDTGNPDDTTVEISQLETGEIRVITRYDHSGFLRFSRSCKVEYVIFTPKDCSIRLKTVSGAAIIEGIQGNLFLNSASGTIDISDLSGEIKTKTVSGKLLCKNISGQAELETVSGKIRAEESDFPKLNITTVSGNAVIYTDIGDGPYRMSSVSGSTKLVVPEQTKCSVQANSLSGRFRTDLTPTNSSITRRSWDVDLEGGGTDIRMKSVSGNFYIVTSENIRGDVPGTIKQSRENRIKILSKLEGGEISVEDAVTQLKL